MDKIIIKGACFLCNIGLSSKERSKKQEIFIDIELFLDIKKAAKTDNIEDTVNYSEVYELIKDLVEAHEIKLIETLVENIAKDILNKFSVEKVLVRIKKPKALANKDVKYVVVEIIREKND